MRAMTLAVGTVMSAGALLLIGGPAFAATAEDPFDVGGARIVDRADVLSATDKEKITTALETLESERGTRLYVVYVDDYGTLTGPDWANGTAVESNLGTNDVLLSIPVDSGSAETSVDSDFSVSSDDLTDLLADAVDPAVENADWVGAATAFADGLVEAQAPSPVPWVIGGVLVAGIGTAVAVPAIRRRGATKRAAEAAQTEVAELDRRASKLLVELDDALKTSEQELGFAQAQFGEASTQDFVTALAAAKQSARQAFELRQKLDDAFPETADQRRAMTEQLIELAGQADATLDAQADKFDELRQLEKNAPQVLEQVVAARATLADRITAAETKLAGLPARFPQADLTSIADAPSQARKLDAFAGTAIDKARAALASAPSTEKSAIGQPTQGPAVAVRAAQQAVGQAEQLVASVDSRERDLVAQAERNAGASRELSDELEDARAQIAAANDYITTHRGAVDSEARTRASEAQRNLDEATAAATIDPPAALASAKRADSLAVTALSLARADVEGFQAASTNGYGYQDSGMSPGRRPDDYNYEASNGAGLGGILTDLFLGGSGYDSDDDSSGSSWWGGGSGGSSGGSGWSWGGSSGGFGGSSRRRSSSGGSRRSSSGGGSRRSSGGGRRR